MLELRGSASGATAVAPEAPRLCFPFYFMLSNEK